MVSRGRSAAPLGRVREFPLPDLGEGLTEGEIIKWLVQVGDIIELNQPIVEVETAKAAVEIPAKWAGQVASIFCEEGTTVEVGTPIIAIDTDPGSAAADLPEPSAASLAAVELAPAEGAIEPGMIGGPAPGGRTAVLVGYGPKNTVAKRRARIVPAETAPALEAPARALAKPPVRKLAKDLGVDLTALIGSGPSGSITRDDVRQATSSPAPVVATPAGPREQRIPVRGIRRLTAQNMVESAFTAPHVTEFLTVDVTRSTRALERLRGRPEWRDVKVSPLLLVAKAALLAIQRYPMINSTWAGDEIIVKDYVNLGIAAATERGLIVPNIKDAGALTLRELATSMSDLVATAKSGRTAPAELSGGTFSITNVGVFGIDTGTPILPPGETTILVFGAIRDQPWVHNGKIKIRKVTTLGASFDHRIVDGELAARFLRDVGDFLNDPGAALLARG
jgi:pyruvate dehydrogenase E2 component (dihydrolipoamide acetyltransferase)